MIAHQITQPVQSWQWQGDNLSTAPLWVLLSCRLNGDELIHVRQSGAQVVYPGEWLVRDLDGGVVFYSAREFERSYTVGQPH